MHASGVHATVAGVALPSRFPRASRINARWNPHGRRVTGFPGQSRWRTKGVTAPILRFEHVLHNFSAFVVMPLFAFANAGVGLAARLITPGSQLAYSSGSLLVNRSALPRQRSAQSNPGSVSFPVALGGRHCSVTPAWRGSGLPCRCLSLCLRSMRLGSLTRQSQVFSPGRFWPGSLALFF